MTYEVKTLGRTFKVRESLNTPGKFNVYLVTRAGFVWVALSEGLDVASVTRAANEGRRNGEW